MKQNFWQRITVSTIYVDRLRVKYHRLENLLQQVIRGTQKLMQIIVLVFLSNP